MDKNQSGQIYLLHPVTRSAEVATLLDTLMQTDWVVYSKACVPHTDTVVAHLARYSHRIAISDQRILGIEEDQVLFRHQDYRDRDKRKVMQLSGVEFIQRFLLQVLPKGLMRLRHYGFLANRCRAEKLKLIRAVLARPGERLAASAIVMPDAPCDGYPCPKCHQGTLRVVYPLPPLRWTGG